ncbi:MAG TPA: YlbF family regulator [Verrucomicrobiae bacterium]|nr:YlbF family regulator [Verrucomicrobiae bacterium]
MVQDDSLVMRKTRELCEVIVAQPEFRSIQERVSAFEADPEARRLYDSLVERHQQLQRQQEMGRVIGDDEMDDFDKLRQQVFDNGVAKGFLDAREQAHNFQMSVRRFVSKTFELGRLPEPEDMDGGGCCESGCSCH